MRVIAKVRGYYGGKVREAGEEFAIPAADWADAKRRPSWVRALDDKAPARTGEAGGGGKVREAGEGGEGAPASIAIPAGWDDLPAKERRDLAGKITGGEPPRTAADADRVINAYLESQKPPAPADNGVVAETGGPAPDWHPAGERNA